MSLTLPPERKGRWRMSGRSRDAPLRWLLLLNGLACPRNETADSQSLFGHHVFGDKVCPGRVTRFHGFLHGYLNWILGFDRYDFMLNGFVSSVPEISGYCFG